MIRIEKPNTVVVHDGLDVSITDGVITIRPIAFIGGGLGGPNWAGQAAQAGQAHDAQLQAYITQQAGQQTKQGHE